MARYFAAKDFCSDDERNFFWGKAGILAAIVVPTGKELCDSKRARCRYKVLGGGN
jgi:hypothetical protein